MKIVRKLTIQPIPSIVGMLLLAGIPNNRDEKSILD
jgi:hypothetical protein